MRRIDIDLSDDRTSAVHRFGGFEGEHNATEITVTLPERMTAETDAEYRFVFETARGEVIFSAPIALEDGKLSVSLVKSLMLAPSLSVTVGCYRCENGTLRRLSKSGKIVLGIQNPEEGEVVEWNGEGGVVPGIVMENEVLADSKNPVKSSALFKALEEKVACDRIAQSIGKEGDENKIPSEKAVVTRLSDFVPQKDFDGAVRRVGDEVYAEKSAFEVFSEKMAQGAASAIRGCEEGNPVRLDDVSPLEHEMAVSVKSKNLLPIVPYDGSKTENGITFTLNDDNSLTIKGTATDVAYFYYVGSGALNRLPIKKGTYTISGANGLSQGTSALVINIQGVGNYNAYDGMPRTINVAEDKSYYFYVAVPQGATLDTTIYPMLETGNTVSSYSKPIDVNGTTVQKLGKNLLPVVPWDKSKTSNGITFTLNDDNSLTIKGTATGTASFQYVGEGTANRKPIKKGIYTISGANGITNASGKLVIGVTGVSEYYVNDGQSRVFNVDEDNTYYFRATILTGTTVNTTIHPMLELGKNATNYEKSEEPIPYIADEDGKVNGIIGNGEDITLMADSGVSITAEYNKDTNKVIEGLVNAIISLGGNV